MVITGIFLKFHITVSLKYYERDRPMLANKKKISVFWFRRDLRLEDNRALYEAMKSPYPVLPVFIFDTEITDELDKDDPRVTFIYDTLIELSKNMGVYGASIDCRKGNPTEVWEEIIGQYEVQAVYANEDYEPYAIKRDARIKALLLGKGIPFYLFKDQVIFAKDEVVKKDETPYTVFTPYKNRWLQKFRQSTVETYLIDQFNYFKGNHRPPDLKALGFERSSIKVKPYSLAGLSNYDQLRDYPALDQTSRLGPQLRFGTVSIREIVKETQSNSTFLSELIWREFFIQILYHYPEVVVHNFKRKYDGVKWRNNTEEFEKWKKGETGYPLVDAGMRELNATGYMHNRVRMVTAGFLCKHLLIDWRWGEGYFAQKLLDYELASNNGNWQWAAGTGCDAAPYFRVFNPTEQVKKFDARMEYIKKWVPEVNSFNYPTPIVEHKFARERAIKTYREGVKN